MFKTPITKIKSDSGLIEDSKFTAESKLRDEFRNEVNLAFEFQDFKEKESVIEELERMVFGASRGTTNLPSVRLKALADHFKDCVFEPVLRYLIFHVLIVKTRRWDAQHSVLCS
jgi:hypothetical protein